MRRIALVVTIDYRTGEYANGWFHVVSEHRTLYTARRKAVQYRRQGYLARVRRTHGVKFFVAIRRPRKRQPSRRDLEA